MSRNFPVFILPLHLKLQEALKIKMIAYNQFWINACFPNSISIVMCCKFKNCRTVMLLKHSIHFKKTVESEICWLSLVHIYSITILSDQQKLGSNEIQKCTLLSTGYLVFKFWTGIFREVRQGWCLHVWLCFEGNGVK